MINPPLYDCLPQAYHQQSKPPFHIPSSVLVIGAASLEPILVSSAAKLQREAQWWYMYDDSSSYDSHGYFISFLATSVSWSIFFSRFFGGSSLFYI